MTEAPTHTIKLDISKVSVVFKDWTTGADDERIQAHYYNGGTVDRQTGAVSYTAETMAAADHEAMTAAIVSIDGSSDNVVERIRHLPLPDNKIVMREVKRIVNPLVASDETDSDATTPAISAAKA